jgi:hypothetical protein
MASLTFAYDLDCSNSRKEPTFTNADITLIKVWNIVETVDLINSFQASLLDHRFCTAWRLFGRLEE